jgi:GTP-binding protein Era
MTTMAKEAFRSGFIGLLGKSNVGKSTLLNRIIQYELAITSPKPQTTRNRILGIKSLPEAQMVFVDTPGINRVQKSFNRYMVREALQTLQDMDLLLLLVEAGGSNRAEDEFVLEHLNDALIPVVLVINKIDLVDKTSLLRLMDEYSKQFAFEVIVPISALSGDGVDCLEKEILRRLNPGPKYFPDEQITDLSERFLAGEVIREKVFRFCGAEIPYSVAVVVEEYRESDPQRPIYIRATVYVEKNSQKGILIGAGGRMLKRIGKAARKDLEERLTRSVFLDLWVKVEKNWSKSEKAFIKLGYK